MESRRGKFGRQKYMKVKKKLEKIEIHVLEDKT